MSNQTGLDQSVQPVKSRINHLSSLVHTENRDNNKPVKTE